MWSLSLQSLFPTALPNLRIPPFFSIWLFPFLALRGTENQNWYLTHRLARIVWVFWGFRLEVYCYPRTRGTCHAIRVSKRWKTCNYSSCCSVCDTSADRNHLRKMHLKCLDTGTGSIGPSCFCDQVASTVEENGDLETSWTAFHSPQTEHRGKTSTHGPGWAFPVSFSVTLSSQIKVSSALSASFCVQLVVQLFCFMLLVFLTIL